MFNKIKRLLTITLISAVVGISVSHFAISYISTQINQENKDQVITLNELIESRVDALQMCIQLNYTQSTTIDDCIQMKDMIVKDIYTKLDSMPYTKFYYNFLDSSNTIEEINKLKEIDFSNQNRGSNEKL